MIDICDFAVGLSRQLHGLTIASERPDHRMLETWHPVRRVRRHLGVQLSGRRVGVERGARARVRQRGRVEAVGEDAADGVGGARAAAADARGVRCVVRRHRAARHRRPRDSAAQLVEHPGRAPRQRHRIDRDGTRRRRGVRATVQAHDPRARRQQRGHRRARARTWTSPLRAIVFAAVGTAGQRCTTLRRLFVHESLYAAFVARLRGNLREHPHRRSARAADARRSAHRRRGLRRDAARARRRRAPKAAPCTGGERVLADTHPDAWYVRPAIVEMPAQTPTMLRETFAPILYVRPYGDARRGDRAQQRGGARTVVVDLHARPHARPRSSFRRAAATAASAT